MFPLQYFYFFPQNNMNKNTCPHVTIYTHKTMVCRAEKVDLSQERLEEFGRHQFEHQSRVLKRPYRHVRPRYLTQGTLPTVNKQRRFSVTHPLTEENLKEYLSDLEQDRYKQKSEATRDGTESRTHEEGSDAGHLVPVMTVPRYSVTHDTHLNAFPQQLVMSTNATFDWDERSRTTPRGSNSTMATVDDDDVLSYADSTHRVLMERHLYRSGCGDDGIVPPRTGRATARTPLNGRPDTTPVPLRAEDPQLCGEDAGRRKVVVRSPESESKAVAIQTMFVPDGALVPLSPQYQHRHRSSSVLNATASSDVRRKKAFCFDDMVRSIAQNAANSGLLPRSGNSSGASAVAKLSSPYLMMHAKRHPKQASEDSRNRAMSSLL
eukprot:PhM_4_TR17412/c0_g1_i1/m.82346